MPAGPRDPATAARVLLVPRLLGLHLLAVAATTVAVLLGVWQLNAWQAGREDQATSLAGAAPRPLDRVMSSDAPFPGDSVGRPVGFRGRWVPASTMYVAGREHDGRNGFWAVTPVEVCPADGGSCRGAPAMLVVRGWTDAVDDAPAPPAGEVDVTGWLQPGEGSGARDEDPRDDVLPELRIADAIQQVDQDLYGGYVIAEQPQEDGLTAVTPDSLPPPDTFTALRNLLYAIEWWVFGAFALFLWVRWCRDEVDRERVVDEAVGPGVGPGIEPGVEPAPRPEETQVTGVRSAP